MLFGVKLSSIMSELSRLDHEMESWPVESILLTCWICFCAKPLEHI